MSRRYAAFGLLLAGALTPLLWGGQDDRSRLDFWKANYSELTSAADPRAAKAAEIFRRVVAAAGKRGGVVPTLFVIKDAGAAVPLAIALPDGGIVISRQVLDICYKEPANGDDRLAFILAHEIAHQLKDDFWHLRFFQAVELSQKAKPGDAAAVEEVRTIAGRSDDALLKELQCDEYGIVYASMAGFDTRAIVMEDDKVNFFKYFAAALDPENIKGATRDATHPTPEARAAAVKARLLQVLDVVDLFDLGVIFYQTGDTETAARLFAEFLRYYPGREVYHDLAACHHQLALKAYHVWKAEGQDFPFKLSLTFDTSTRARKIVLRGEPGPEARFKEELAKAVELYRSALGQDPAYWPSANNLGCALLLQENAYEAVAVLQKAAQGSPGSAQVLSNLGVAFYQTENAAKAKEKLQAALTSSPDFDAALYNLGQIASAESDAAGASRYWDAYLKIDPDGPWAGRILAKRTPGQAPKAAAMPVPAASPPEPLAELKIGDYTDAVPADWGAPVVKKTFFGEDRPVSLMSYANGVTVVAKEDEIVRLAASGACRAKTAQGLSLGAGRADVLAAYGRPVEIWTSEGEALAYPGRGIAFTFRDGKVASWIVFKPA
jgi:tetratricopeptide (TPR) repeat protein